MSTCSKPGCTRGGAALLAYDYSAAEVTLHDPPAIGSASPHLYVFCSSCAERLRPPRGWVLNDRRSPGLLPATG